MTAQRTWKIRDWDCDKQSYGPERTVTLAQFKAENQAKAARALEIHRANVAKMQAGASHGR